MAHLNTDGSEDLGVMQVNTVWIPRLVRYTRMDAATVRARLLGDTCFNIAAAGLIMRTYLDEANGDLMRAVGFYHSHTAAFHEAYKTKVLRSASRLFAGR